MKKNLFLSTKILLAALLLPLGFANAQTKPNPLLEAPEPIPKWELSVDLKPLIGRSSGDGIGYILRKYTKHNTAFRFKFLPSFFIEIPSIPNTESPGIYYTYGGYEWIKKKKKGSFFYGFDVSYRGSFDARVYNSIIGLEGFVGVRQNVINNLSISLESHAGIAYQYARNLTSSATHPDKIVGVLMPTVQPLFGLYLNYQLF